MNYLSTDHLIVYASLLFTLIVGLWSGRGIKTIREYAIANKMFGTSVLVLTYLATHLSGGSILNAAGLTFSHGIIVFIACLGCIINFFVTAFIAPKAIYFADCISMGDLLKSLYGDFSGVLAGILGVLRSIFMAGMQFVALGIVCESLLGIDMTWSIVIGGTILTLYSAHGGIKSVATTDVLQFLMLIVGIPMIAYMAVSHVGNIQQVFTQLPAAKLEVFGHEKFPLYLNLFLMWSMFPMGLADPAIIQRLLMGRSEQQLRRQYFIVAVFDPIFRFIVTLIGLASIVLYTDTEIKPNDVVPQIINEFLPIGIKGFVIAGLFAIIMSTADSYLHVAGLNLVHDVIKPLYDKKNMASNKKQTGINEYKWAKVVTTLLGLIAITIGLSTTDMLALLLISLEFIAPLLMFPLIAGMMGLKPEKRAFYTAIFVTLATWIISKLFLPAAQRNLATLISTLANGITFFGVHFVINKGFATIDHQKRESLSI